MLKGKEAGDFCLRVGSAALCLFLPASPPVFSSLSPFPLHRHGISCKMNGSSQERIKRHGRSVRFGEGGGLGPNRNSERCSSMFSDSSGSCESAEGDVEMWKRRLRGAEALLFFFFF